MPPVKKFSLNRLRIGAVLLAGYWLLMFAGTHLPNLPAGGGPDVNDKVEHFSAYFGLAILLCFVSTAPRSAGRVAAVVAIAIAYGVFDELTQLLVPGRHADWLDFAADTAGVLTAVALYTTAGLLYRYQRRSRSDWQRG